MSKATTITSNTAIADRRSFFQLAGASAVAATASTMGATASVAATSEKPVDAMYQESAHVKRYYELAR